jgi:hypothetical protein
VLIVQVWYLFEDGFSLPLCACGLVEVVVVLVMAVVEWEEREQVLLLSKFEELVDEAILCGEREDLVLLSWL